MGERMQTNEVQSKRKSCCLVFFLTLIRDPYSITSSFPLPIVTLIKVNVFLVLPFEQYQQKFTGCKASLGQLWLLWCWSGGGWGAWWGWVSVVAGSRCSFSPTWSCLSNSFLHSIPPSISTHRCWSGDVWQPSLSIYFYSLLPLNSTIIWCCWHSDDGGGFSAVDGRDTGGNSHGWAMESASAITPPSLMLLGYSCLYFTVTAFIDYHQFYYRVYIFYYNLLFPTHVRWHPRKRRIKEFNSKEKTKFSKNSKELNDMPTTKIIP